MRGILLMFFKLVPIPTYSGWERDNSRNSVSLCGEQAGILRVARTRNKVSSVSAFPNRSSGTRLVIECSLKMLRYTRMRPVGMMLVIVSVGFRYPLENLFYIGQTDHRPPVISKIAPVEYEASSESSHKIALATSSG